jgi:hypothetical protein
MSSMLRNSRSRCLRCALPTTLLAVAFLTLASPVRAQVPLHDRIDSLVAAGTPNFASLAAAQASDAELLRRLELDLTGTIPTAAETRAFLADHSPEKQRQLIDRLLASPEYARHMQEVFDVMLMERRPAARVPQAQWQDYLRASFAANKPWDQLVREILSADGADAKLRPAAHFYLGRQGDPNLLTRDISRLLLGKNLQCAQCHDHPLVEDYKQDHYYGIYAFLNRSFLFTGKDKQVVFAEKAEGDVTFQSVFDPAKVTKATGPRLLDRPALKEPKFAKGQEYLVAPAKGVRPIPKFSRRALLAGQITDRGDVPFRRNIVNRLWALMMGRGLVQPLDYDHSGNPPANAELLTLLADQFAAMKYDVRAFLRELALTRTYQRSSELPAGIKEVPPETFAVANLKPLTPEQLAWSLMQATGLTDVERRALGKNARETTLHARLAGNVTPFVTTFGSQAGHPEGESFEATLDQALFVDNGALVRGWLAPRPGNLADRLLHLQDGKSLAEELYLSVLTRLPVAEERQEAARYLKGREKDKAAALAEMEWALLASAEFRFNH